MTEFYSIFFLSGSVGRAHIENTHDLITVSWVQGPLEATII